MERRQFLKAGAAGLAATLAGCADMPGAAPKARVVVVGGGYGGATAARYIRRLDPANGRRKDDVRSRMRRRASWFEQLGDQLRGSVDR